MILFSSIKNLFTVDLLFVQCLLLIIIFKENISTLGRAKMPASSNLIKWNCPVSPSVKIKFDGLVSNSMAAGGFVLGT